MGGLPLVIIGHVAEASWAILTSPSETGLSLSRTKSAKNGTMHSVNDLEEFRGPCTAPHRRVCRLRVCDGLRRAGTFAALLRPESINLAAQFRDLAQTEEA
jgi:hypothetical protein